MLFKPTDTSVLNQIVAKQKKLQKVEPSTRKGGNLMKRINTVCEHVQRKLGHYKEQLELIQTKERLHEYINTAIEQDIISIDTETTGLDPITDKIVGACIYTRGEKPAYIPINHVSYLNNRRLDGQLTEKEVAEEFQRLIDKQTKAIFFNAKFDIRVMRWQLGVFFTPAHCGFIAGKCLKEDEPEGNLKFLWKKYCCPPDFEEPALTFDKMFEGMKFNLIPISTAYLYAAKDALMTLQLYDFQMQYLDETNPKCQAGHLEKVAKLYREIELPIINIVADIEDQGVVIDVDYGKKLSEEYNKKLKEAEEKFHEAILPYYNQINSYINSHPETKLENPININSPIQIAELFYDVLKVPSPSKKDPRGTGKDILKAMGHPLCEYILEYKNIAKLVSTYIDALPQMVNKKTGRLHCNFNQYGANTGRFSSSNPNFQNLPSRGEGGKIRRLFKAADYVYVSCKNNILTLLIEDIVPTTMGEKLSQNLVVRDSIVFDTGFKEIVDIQKEEEFIFLTIKDGEKSNCNVKRIHLLVGSDFSQQEPKLTADLTNDEKFISDCASGKDAYSTIASIAFKVPYEDCLEFYLDENGNKTHETNKAGKERRSIAKILLLGICYGKTMKSIAEDLHKTEQEAQEIYDAVMTNIGGLKRFMEEAQEFARVHGYVEDKWGRRRHIPDMQLEPYVLTSKGNANFDPFFDSVELGVVNDTERKKLELIEELKQAKWRSQKEKVKEKIDKEGFNLRENTKKIEDATRQCVNSVVQGSASTQSKIAIRLIGQNKELKRLGFKMAILVHDEILGEMPYVTAKKVVPLFQQGMLSSANDLRTGAKCDMEISRAWYGESIEMEDLTFETLRNLQKQVYGDNLPV